MIRRIYNTVFIIIFMIMLFLPFILSDKTISVSQDENRMLASDTQLFINGRINEKFASDYESWFRDHMGLRRELINTNVKILYNSFNKFVSRDWYLGKSGDIIYAPKGLLLDYQHLNLRTDMEVDRIGQSYQKISDWLEDQNIQFYYVQCYDKHSIYPEQMMDTIPQYGEISKTDQVIGYLKEKTTVNVISLKDILLLSKESYEVYSNFGDATHWTQRGAFIGYQYIMEQINMRNSNKYHILQEDEYDISIEDLGSWINCLHFPENLESFSIHSSQARLGDISFLGTYSEDNRHRCWENNTIDNDTRLLIMGDSYINTFIIEDFAESFNRTCMVWNAYTTDLEEIIDLYKPDIVIFECAERVDSSNAVCNLADKLDAAKSG